VGWRVIWTTPAWSDVEEVASFIARDSPRYAVVLQRNAQAAAKSLREFPRRCRIVPERGDERLRELIVSKSYRLIFKLVADDEVHVIALYTALVTWMRFFSARAGRDRARQFLKIVMRIYATHWILKFPLSATNNRRRLG